MRDLSAMRDALASDATTLCRCWRLTRRDGAVLGFTDHDRDVRRGGAVFKAASGLDASQVEASVGLGSGIGDVQGALSADSLTEADLANGVYDDASVEIWTVDWTDPDRAVLMDVATIGKVRRSEHAFVAELRSLAHRFDEERGRRYQRNCAADLGDARCRVDLSDPAFSTSGVVTARGQHSISVRLDRAFPPGFFAGGRLRKNGGGDAAIRSHQATGSGDLFAVASPDLFAPGDRVALSAGCDKSPETCIAKFGNIANFRGFPHMPGNDVLLAYPNSHGPAMDGGSLFR